MMKKIRESVGAMGLLVTMLAATGCAGWGKTSCAVVDAAQAACTVVRFMGDDGKLHEVQVSKEEAKAFGEEMGAKRAAEKRGSK